MSRSRAAFAIGTLAAVAVALGATFVLLRPTGTTTTPGGVAVECVGVDAAECAIWAESTLADGPGIHTFDPEDLERVRLSHSFLGLFGDCQAEYFLGRYDEAVAREIVDCYEGFRLL